MATGGLSHCKFECKSHGVGDAKNPKIRWRRWWLSAWKTIARRLTDYWKHLSSLFFGGVSVATKFLQNKPPTQINGCLNKLLWHFSSEREWILGWGLGPELVYWSSGDPSGWARASTLERMRGQLEKLRICHTTLWLYSGGDPKQQQQPQQQMQQSLRCLRRRMLNHHKNVANRNRTCLAIVPPPSSLLSYLKSYLHLHLYLFCDLLWTKQSKAFLITWWGS